MLPPIVQKYMLTTPTTGPGQAKGETIPLQRSLADLEKNNATVLYNGEGYFKALETEINTLIGRGGDNSRYFYLSAWWLGLHAWNTDHTVNGWAGNYTFNPQATLALKLPSGNTLASRLIALERSGVDVRILAWLHPIMLRLGLLAKAQFGLSLIALQNLLSGQLLRESFSNNGPERVMFNTLAHTMGAVHMKMVAFGDSTDGAGAFVGGIDPEQRRIISPYYVPYSDDDPDKPWHDIAVRVEGKAAVGVRDFFRLQWNEQLRHDPEVFKIDGKDIVSHDKTWPSLTAPTPAPKTTGTKFIQVLRTVPQMNFGQATSTEIGRLLAPDSIVSNQAIVGSFVKNFVSSWNRPKWVTAPDGIFEFKQALRRAISRADKYIFIADQGLYAFDVMEWIRERLMRPSPPKVILVYGADPADPPNNFLAEALNNRLCRTFTIDSATKQPKNIRVFNWAGVTVHCKVTLIDDAWCAIGSANCMNRSLYTDVELSLGIAEEPTPEASLPQTASDDLPNPPAPAVAPTFIQDFRRTLWAGYCGIDPNDPSNAAALKRFNMLKLQHALGIWDATWASPPLMGLTLEPNFKRLRFPVESPWPFKMAQYDQADVDSRQAF